MEKIDWKKSNFLISKKVKSLIVVSKAQTKEEAEKSDHFTGVIVNADDSEHNNVLQWSNQYKKSYFEYLDPEKVKVTWE